MMDVNSNMFRDTASEAQLHAERQHSSCLPGCIFQYHGKIPESAYRVESFSSPLEEAVFDNNVTRLDKLVNEGHVVHAQLKIGDMACIEYAAMMGYDEILQKLINRSINASILKQYFALNDVVERAYMISYHKAIFFDCNALAEANRYEAALFAAVEYNRPQCVEVMVECARASRCLPSRFLHQRQPDGAAERC
ncbi:hypothetical protein NP493_549g01033 [Ridgeia piscesae]|uniref:Uncharacterized protein n=1 Tax=Ridgeia piscesae TaxID=27915 RepID=A0AAD9KVV3_RIDPI|nr:hypothetical protein NP493_549g01033 [Ridgeia piscesae]